LDELVTAVYFELVPQDDVLALLRDKPAAVELVLTGRRAGAHELAEHHVIEKACADEQALMAEAMAYARGFQKKRGIFAEHKRRLHKHIITIIDNEDPPYIESLSLMVQD
jgi:ATP:corrinoid adenosyltransferase